MRRLAWLGVAVVLYSVAAWSVAPGFYDGFGPPQPYNFTCPPAQAGANTKPSSGHLEIKVINGVSDANSAFTDDGQIVIGFLPGTFDVTGKTSVTVDITPLDTCPKPPGLEFVTNVYRVTADAPLVKESTLTMRYSNLLPDPQAIYQTPDDPNGTWKSLGRSDQAQPYTVNTKVTSLGYFAAGYSATSPAPDAVRVGGGQVLPIVVAVLIVVVVLAGLPLAVVRRRRGTQAEDEDDE